jgi:hypothetical protein
MSMSATFKVAAWLVGGVLLSYLVPWAILVTVLGVIRTAVYLVDEPAKES